MESLYPSLDPQSRLTLGGCQINYPDDVVTLTVYMLLGKILLNSIISTEGAKFMQQT